MAYIKAIFLLKSLFMMVGEEGLEPSILAKPVPKTGAYTNSATRPFFLPNEVCTLKDSNLGPSP